MLINAGTCFEDIKHLFLLYSGSDCMRWVSQVPNYTPEYNPLKYQYASVVGGDIAGYIEGANDGNGNVRNILFVNFKKCISVNRDMRRFIHNLFTVHNTEKIVFDCAVKNPAYIMFHKIIHKYGGRQVGVFRYDRVYRGTLTDVAYFEIEREQYVR